MEVNIHRVGELEGLEVRKANDRRRRSKVFNLLEFTHNLWSHNAAMLVDKLNWRSFSIVSHAISHQHIELVFIVFDCQHHRHCLTNLYNSADLRSPRTFADLNLHPTLKVIAQEVCGDSVKHVNLERSEGDGFLVEVVPRATQFASLLSKNVKKSQIKEIA